MREPLIHKINILYIIILCLDIVLTFLILSLVDREFKWAVCILTALLVSTIIMAMPNKQKLFTSIFFLSFQVDIYFRLFYGRANSTEGIATPLVVITGMALCAWYWVTKNLSEFRWGGSMRWPILAIFVTTMLSLATTSERFIGFSTLWWELELYFVYWLTFNIVRSDNDFKKIVRLLLVTLALQSLIYYVQSALGITFNFMGETIKGEGITRPGGTVSSNPAGFTSFIMPALLMVSTIAIARTRFFPRSCTFVLMLLGIGAIGLSFTRAAWIGFAMGFITVVFLGFRKRAIQGQLVVWIAVFVCIAFVALLPTMHARISENYASSGGDPNKTALDERVGLMKIAMNIITAHPLTGIGPGAYGFVFKGFLTGRENQWLFTVHNEFLLRAAETGIPGALAFMALLIVGFRLAWRLAQSRSGLISICALGWFGALVALVWQMNWVPWRGFSYNAMLWLMLGLMDGAQRLVWNKSGGLPHASMGLRKRGVHELATQ